VNGTAGVGVFASSLRDVHTQPAEALDLARRNGFDAVMFSSAFALSPGLDHHELANWRDRGAHAGVELHVASVNLHPHRVGQDRLLLRAGDGDALRGLRRAIEASAVLGPPDMTAVVGRIEDRFDPLIPWPEQLSAASALLRRIAPVLRGAGMRLALKTHEEITTMEVLRLVEAAGTEAAAIAFDPVNALVTMEDPVSAATRIAAYATQVIVDDAELEASDGTARRLLCPVGQGVVDWSGAVTATRAAGRASRFWVELHRGQFAIRPYDQAWLAAHPDLEVHEYAAVMRLVAASTGRLTPQRRAGLAAAQARPTTRLHHAMAACGRLLSHPARPVGPAHPVLPDRH
jgi:sugar phosphate isomerase/epimerase